MRWLELRALRRIGNRNDLRLDASRACPRLAGRIRRTKGRDVRPRKVGRGHRRRRLRKSGARVLHDANGERRARRRWPPRDHGARRAGFHVIQMLVRELSLHVGAAQDRRNYSRGRTVASRRAFACPRGQGMWPAFWMLGADIDTAGWPRAARSTSWRTSAANRAWCTARCMGPGIRARKGSASRSRCRRRPFADDFHVFAVEWRPDDVRWYVDGRSTTK